MARVGSGIWSRDHGWKQRHLPSLDQTDPHQCLATQLPLNAAQCPRPRTTGAEGRTKEWWMSQLAAAGRDPGMTADSQSSEARPPSHGLGFRGVHRGWTTASRHSEPEQVRSLSLSKHLTAEASAWRRQTVKNFRYENHRLLELYHSAWI